MRVGILGSGPAGFYAAQAVLKRIPGAKVDIIERLPVPFGLIRYGVAPDHPATKNVITGFSKFVEDNRNRVRFLGNIPALESPALSHEVLAELYNVIIIATGAKGPRSLNNRSLPKHGVYSAQDFIFWVNGHPEVHENPSLACKENPTSMHNLIAQANHVGVVGVGNVAIDVARLLLRPAADLRSTDISPAALEALKKSPVSKVSLFGRRRPLNASWTTAALREIITKIPGVLTRCNHALLKRDIGSENLSRAIQRKLRLLQDNTEDLNDGHTTPPRGNRATLNLEFLLEPKSILRNAKAIEIQFSETASSTDSQGPSSQMNPAERQAPSKVFEKRSFDSVILSLGYEGDSGDGIRVGWANGHGKGIIGDNKLDADTVVKQLVLTEACNLEGSTRHGLDELVQGQLWEAVTWEGWKRIDAHEKRLGQSFGNGRERVKLESVSEMLSVARGAACFGLQQRKLYGKQQNI